MASDWTTNIASGSFANIRNNPSLQEVNFAAGQRPVFPLHGLAGNQCERLDERGGNFRPARRREW